MEALNLICPVHGDALREEGGNLVSARGAIYPIVCGVPILVQGVRIEPRAVPIPSGTIDQLVDTLALESLDRAALELAFGHRFVFQEEWIQTEADQFLHHFGSTNEGLRRALGSAPPASSAPPSDNASRATRWGKGNDASLRQARGQAKAAPVAEPAAEDPPRISSIFTLSKIRPNDWISVNVRLENCGRTAYTPHGDNPMRLSYHWIQADGTQIEGRRTELLDPLPPGRSITMPVFLDTPKEDGRYVLSIRCVQEGLRWFNDSAVEYDIDVATGTSTVDDPQWQRTGRHFEYEADHLEGIRLLEKWRDTLFDRPVERIVELGGNANPMIDHFDAAHRYNVDVDAYGMIIGNLARAAEPDKVRFIVADGMDLPMDPRSIDIIVMFATFHHFPDPVALLSRLSDVVADDGLICLMCEPIGHVHSDTVNQDFLEQIRRGVNIQSFALWEYQQMFDAANLEVVAAQIDVGSAKIALRPRRA